MNHEVVHTLISYSGGAETCTLGFRVNHRWFTGGSWSYTGCFTCEPPRGSHEIRERKLTQKSVSQYRAPESEPATVILADGGSLLSRNEWKNIGKGSGKDGVGMKVRTVAND